MRSSVDLPHPEGPTSTRNSPSVISSDNVVPPRQDVAGKDLPHMVEDDPGHRTRNSYRTAAERSMALTNFEPVGYSRSTL